jgi:hypothetical protein
MVWSRGPFGEGLRWIVCFRGLGAQTSWHKRRELVTTCVTINDTWWRKLVSRAVVLYELKYDVSKTVFLTSKYSVRPAISYARLQGSWSAPPATGNRRSNYLWRVMACHKPNCFWSGTNMSCSLCAPVGYCNFQTTQLRYSDFSPILYNVLTSFWYFYFLD